MSSTTWRLGRLMALLMLAGMPLATQARSDGAAQAAMRLAEAIYPGELRVHDTHVRKGYVEVVLAPRGDPVTRIVLAMDPDPDDCRPGTPCETRLRRAYALGHDEGQEMRALETAFRDCGMPVVAVQRMTSAGLLIPVVSQRLQDSERDAVVHALTACARLYRERAQTAPWWHARDGMRIMLVTPANDRTPLPVPAPLTLDATVPATVQGEPAYAAIVAFAPTQTEVRRLTFAPYRPLQETVQRNVATAVQRYLRAQPDGITPETRIVLRGTSADPTHLHVIHTYVLACTPGARQAGRCSRGDIALRIQYDLQANQVEDIRHAPLVRDALGSPLLPPLSP